MCVPCCAAATVSTAAVGVTAAKGGKDPSATCKPPTASTPGAPGTASASKGSACVGTDGPGTRAKTVSFQRVWKYQVYLRTGVRVSRAMLRDSSSNPRVMLLTNLF